MLFAVRLTNAGTRLRTVLRLDLPPVPFAADDERSRNQPRGQNSRTGEKAEEFRLGVSTRDHGAVQLPAQRLSELFPLPLRSTE